MCSSFRRNPDAVVTMSMPDSSAIRQQHMAIPCSPDLDKPCSGLDQVVLHGPCPSLWCFQECGGRSGTRKRCEDGCTRKKPIARGVQPQHEEPIWVKYCSLCRSARQKSVARRFALFMICVREDHHEMSATVCMILVRSACHLRSRIPSTVHSLVQVSKRTN